MSNFEQKKRGRPRRTDPHFCSPLCGYNTFDLANLARHRSTCKKIEMHNSRESVLEELTTKEQELATINKHLADTKDQLAAKDRQMAEKDEQIKQLIKRPRTVTHHNRFVVNNSVNCFGRESLEHITEAKYQELLRDPETSVAKVVALQRTVPENENVVIPNVRERRWLVVEEEGGEKQWRSKDKGQVLEQLWESSTCLLEGEADEETPVGARWSRWADKVRSDVDGRLYREQLDMVEHSILDGSREHRRGLRAE